MQQHPKKVLGRYEIVEPLAKGGMAEVFRAVLRGPDGFTKEFAIKQMLPELSADPMLVEMFLDEARLASRLTHPNICQIFELGQQGEHHYIAMEYLSGQVLSRLLTHAMATGVPLPPVFSAWVIARAAEGLAYAHERLGTDGVSLGIVHRDVSPDNIMVTTDGQVKVLDFGIARASHHTVKTQTGTVRGKIGYMAPEQIRGEPIDGRADVFSLGVVLWGLLANTHLFRHLPDAQAMFKILSPELPPRPDNGVPAVLWEIAEAALQRDVGQRLASAQLMVSRLDAFCATQAQAGPALLAQVVRDRSEPSSKPMVIEAATRTSGAPVELATVIPLAQPIEADRKRTRTVAASLPVRSRAPMLGGAAVALAMLGAAAWAFWPGPPVPAVVEVPRPVVVAVPQRQMEEAVVAPPTPAAVPVPISAPVPVPVRPTARSSKPVKSPRTRTPPANLQTEPVAPAVKGVGRLTLDTQPWAQVFLDGRLLGDTPLEEVSVPAGHLRLRLLNPESKIDRYIEVDIAPGAVTRVRK